MWPATSIGLIRIIFRKSRIMLKSEFCEEPLGFVRFSLWQNCVCDSRQQPLEHNPASAQCWFSARFGMPTAQGFQRLNITPNQLRRGRVGFILQIGQQSCHRFGHSRPSNSADDKPTWGCCEPAPCGTTKGTHCSGSSAPCPRCDSRHSLS